MSRAFPGETKCYCLKDFFFFFFFIRSQHSRQEQVPWQVQSEHRHNPKPLFKKTLGFFQLVFYLYNVEKKPDMEHEISQARKIIPWPIRSWNEIPGNKQTRNWLVLKWIAGTSHKLWAKIPLSWISIKTFHTPPEGEWWGPCSPGSWHVVMVCTKIHCIEIWETMGFKTRISYVEIKWYNPLH